MLFGTNPFSGVLLKAIDLNLVDIPRFRDCYLNENGSKIVVYTRTGGGNREDYERENDFLADHPGFISDCDNDFDCTYASFFYEVPEEFRPMIDVLKTMGAEDNPQKKFAQLITDLENKEQNPATERALEVGRGIFDQISKLPDGGTVQI